MRLLVNTAELRHAVGAEKLIEGSVEPAEVGVDDARLEPGAPVLVDLRLESVNDGVLVTGTVSARWRGECRRCLTAAGDAAVALLDERYQYTVTDPNAFPIDNDQLDLVPLVREAVLLELPDAPLCRPDCAGLCGSCGADLNAGPCGCSSEPADPRWGALDDLKRSLES